MQTSLTKVWFHRNSLRSSNVLESYTPDGDGEHQHPVVAEVAG